MPSDNTKHHWWSWTAGLDFVEKLAEWDFESFIQYFN